MLRREGLAVVHYPTSRLQQQSHKTMQQDRTGCWKNLPACSLFVSAHVQGATKRQLCFLVPGKRAVTTLLQGSQDSVVAALDIICDAVDRYKELCEGRYCGTQPRHLY